MVTRYGPYCPKCGSRNVNKERSEFGGQDTGDYLCEGCGYTGMRTDAEWFHEKPLPKDTAERATQED